MKYIVIVALVAYIGFIAFNATEAFALGQSVGGRITSTTYPNTQCNGGTGPVSFTPAGNFAGSYYYFPQSSQGSSPSPSKQFLGLSRFQSIDCWTQVLTYRIPFLTQNVYYYGVSTPVQTTSWGTYR